MKDGIKFVCISTIILLVIGGINVGVVADGEHIQVLKRNCSSFSISESRDPSVVLLGDGEELDQEQWYSDSGFKIYGGHWAAQSFTPAADRVSKVCIMVNKTEKKSFSSEIIGCLKRFGGLGEKINDMMLYRAKRASSLDLGDITVSIRKDLYGSDLVSISLSKDRIPKYGAWIEFDFPDIYVKSGATYYIVVHASGGDEKHYYRWRYKSSNVYSFGYGFTSYDDGGNWNTQYSWDFAFTTYGIDDRDADGVVERWAVLVGISDYAGTEHDLVYCREDAIDMKNLLTRHGWQEDHIRVLTDSQATIDNIGFAIKQIDFKEDNDDIVLLQFSAHGGPRSLAVYPLDIFYASDLDKDLDKLESKNMALIFQSCHSGGLRDYLGQSGRVILAAAAKDEKAWVGNLGNTVFTYFLLEAFDGRADTNHDGWVSAEEAFYYAGPKTTEHEEKEPGYDPPQHPQIYDGYPTEENNTGELPITKV